MAHGSPIHTPPPFRYDLGQRQFHILQCLRYTQGVTRHNASTAGSDPRDNSKSNHPLHMVTKQHVYLQKLNKLNNKELHSVFMETAVTQFTAHAIC